MLFVFGPLFPVGFHRRRSSTAEERCLSAHVETTLNVCFTLNQWAQASSTLSAVVCTQGTTLALLLASRALVALEAQLLRAVVRRERYIQIGAYTYTLAQP